MPDLIIEAVFDDSAQNLNRLPRKTGVFKHLSPLTIVTGIPKLIVKNSSCILVSTLKHMKTTVIDPTVPKLGIQLLSP